jgi:hypothetical protein
MPADIVQTTLLLERMQECVTLMDDYGNIHRVYINITQSATRAAKISAVQALMENLQTQLEAYATANGHDLSADKLPSLAAKQAKIKASRK